jgi:hypothetical protein
VVPSAELHFGIRLKRELPSRSANYLRSGGKPRKAV